MSLRFAILGSGSSGNCALLETARCRILIDAGFSARKIGELLEARGLHPDELDAVFITHEHGDHAAGVNGLSRRPALKVFANPGTIEAITPRLRRRPTWQAFTTGARFHFADLEVESFPIPHDAGDPVGFIFRHGEGDLFSPRQSLAWVTDLGHAPALVAERIRDVDTLVIEANHDPGLLRADRKRPWAVKQRITGRHGHLSNEAARDFLLGIGRPRWRRVFLGHLSRDCNSTGHVEQAFAPLRERLAATAFEIVPPEGATAFHELA